MRILYYFFPILSCGFIISSTLIASSNDSISSQLGFSPLHKLKYSKNFNNFDYVNPDAPKGGRIRIGRRGSFNSLNFLKYPGRTPIGRTTLPIGLMSYLYDSMLTVSADETAGYYNLLASVIEVDKNYRWVRFTIREDARWHDGKAITADDVVFTFHTLKDQGAPVYKQILRTISIFKDGDKSVIYRNAQPGDRGFVEVVGILPVHPKHYWQQHDVTKTGMSIPLGSGPYKIIRVNAGKSLRLQRTPEYWAANHPVNKGRYNFDQIDLEFYMDDNVALTAFKAGQYDLRHEQSAINWAKSYDSQSLRDKQIKLASVVSDKPGSLVRLIFNVRRPVFQNRKVRKAFALLYNFKQINSTLFHGRYEKIDSVFGNSALAAKEQVSSRERDLLQSFLKFMPETFLKHPAPKWRSRDYSEREALKLAGQLMNEAGYIMKDGKRIDPKTKSPLVLSVAFTNPAHRRVLASYANRLKRLGVIIEFPLLSPLAAHQKLLGHNYDLAVMQSHPAIITGPREELLWGSRNADAKRSYAFAGVKDRALDKIINNMKNARNLEGMQVATRAFDRVLRWQVYDVPLWKTSKQWLAYRDVFGMPNHLPKYNLSFVDRWWYKPEKIKQSKLNKE